LKKRRSKKVGWEICLCAAVVAFFQDTVVVVARFGEGAVNVTLAESWSLHLMF